MRVIVAAGVSGKSRVVADEKISVRNGLLLDFPVSPKKVKVSVVRDGKTGRGWFLCCSSNSFSVLSGFYCTPKKYSKITPK
jgi:hypothetical protein